METERVGLSTLMWIILVSQRPLETAWGKEICWLSKTQISLVWVLHELGIIFLLCCTFNSMWTEKFQIYKLDLERAKGPEIKLPTFVGSYRKQGNFRKTSTSVLLSTPKPLTVWITTNCGKVWKRWEYQTCLLRNLYAGQEQQLEPDMEQWTGSKLGKEHVKALFCHPAYLTYMQSTLWETLGWMKQK